LRNKCSVCRAIAFPEMSTFVNYEVPLPMLSPDNNVYMTVTKHIRK